MPVLFTRLDMHDVADINLTLFRLVRHHARAGSHHQNLVTIMLMPAGGGTLAEAHNAAFIVVGIPLGDDRLTGPRHGTAGPAGYGRGFAERNFINAIDGAYTLGNLLLLRGTSHPVAVSRIAMIAW